MSNKLRNLVILHEQSVSNNIALPKKLQKYIGQQRGKPAGTHKENVDWIPVNTPMNETQRDLHINDVFKWIEQHKGVDWNLFGYATAVRYNDQSLELINGQHRIELVKMLLPDQMWVPAHIIDISDDHEYAAKLFAAMNGVSSRKLTSEELFWAECISKDPFALYVKTWLERCDIACGKVNGGNKRKNVKHGGFVKCLRMGEEATAKAVELIDAAWPDQGIDDQVLVGLARLLSLDEYSDMAKPETKIGADFEQWFVEQFGMNHRISDARFNEYKNTMQWFNGVAYGIAQRFRHYQKRMHRTSSERIPKIELIEKIYKDGIQGINR